MKYVVKHNFYSVFRSGRWSWTTNINEAKLYSRRPLSDIRNFQHDRRNQEPFKILGFELFYRDFEIRQVEINLL